MVFLQKLFRFVMGFLVMFVENLKGTKTVTEIRSPKNALGNLTGYAIAGYQINIYCQRKHYRRSYDKWFIPDQHHITYRVFSVVTNDAPDGLKMACELDVDLPSMLPEYVNDEQQRSAVVQAYLDILVSRLGPQQQSKIG